MEQEAVRAAASSSMIAGSTSPSRTITGFPGCPSGIAADASGNSFLTYVYYPATGTFLQSDVIEYA